MGKVGLSSKPRHAIVSLFLVTVSSAHTPLEPIRQGNGNEELAWRPSVA